MTTPQPLQVRELIREARRLHRTRHLQRAWVRAKLNLAGKPIRVQLSDKCPTHGLRAARSFKEATGWDALQTDFPGERFERLAHSAFRVLMGR